MSVDPASTVGKDEAMRDGKGTKRGNEGAVLMSRAIFTSRKKSLDTWTSRGGDSATVNNFLPWVQEGA